MANSADETGFSEERDPTTFMPKEPGWLETPLEDDDLSHLIVHPTPFPISMAVTGVLWILAGGAYIAFFALLRLLGVPFQINDIWLLIGAFFFTKDGIQLVRGKFRDPQWDGVISVLLGIFLLGMGWYRYDETGSVLPLIIDGLFGSIFLIPGILVFLGRKQYLAWKAEQEARFGG